MAKNRVLGNVGEEEGSQGLIESDLPEGSDLQRKSDV
jgi:hypothetical protein